MIRLRSLFWLLLISATGFAMFGVKYQVQALEDQLARIDRAAAAEEHEIRVLDAEWAYLTRPQTLEAMNRQFLSLVPTSTKQLRTTVVDIPMRALPPAPPQPVEAATMVASAEPSPVPNAAPSPAEEPSAPVTEPAKPAAEPPQAKSALRAMPALLEKPTANAQIAKAVPAKTAARSSPTHRAKSIDDLISQIMASR
jgi:hypothetical protein